MSGSDAATRSPNATRSPATIDRAAMFAAGPPKLARRTIWIALGITAVLGIGGAFADHSFNVQSTPTPTPVVRHAAGQRETLAQFVGLRVLKQRAAPVIDLTDGTGSAFSLVRLAGRPVLLTFLGATCTASCPVVAAEIAGAEALLARAGLRPVVVLVNADPQHLSLAAARAALSRGPLAAVHDAVFLTGPLRQIQRVWKAYGVTIELDPASGALAYTNVLYLIDPAGNLRDSLTPFANESFDGTASLPSAEVERFSTGIATYLEAVAR